MFLGVRDGKIGELHRELCVEACSCASTPFRVGAAFRHKCRGRRLHDIVRTHWREVWHQWHTVVANAERFAQELGASDTDRRCHFPSRGRSNGGHDTIHDGALGACRRDPIHRLDKRVTCQGSEAAQDVTVVDKGVENIQEIHPCDMAAELSVAYQRRTKRDAP